MNPFLEIPVCLSGKEGDDQQPEKEVVGRLLPGEIAFHYPGYHWGAIVVLKSGHSFLTKMTSEEIDAARQAYHKIMKEKPENTANIQLKAKQKPLIHAAD